MFFQKQLTNQCEPNFFVQDVINKTVENVLSSIYTGIKTVAVAETETPTQRYKVDSTLCPWLKKDEELSKIEQSEFYYCKCCRALGDSAHTVGLFCRGCLVRVVFRWVLLNDHKHAQ